MFIPLLLVFSMIFWVVALIDIARRDFKNPNDKIVWILIVIFTHFIGALIYWLAIKPKESSSPSSFGLTDMIAASLLLVSPFFWIAGVVGIIIMWAKTKWSKTIKIVVSIVFALLSLILLSFGALLFLLASQSPAKEMAPAKISVEAPQIY
jgi:hypothetical protein